MDKKSDTRMLASPATPGMSPSSRPGRERPGRERPAVPPPIAPGRVEPEEFEEPLQEAIFRPTLNEDGEAVIEILPPTFYNLTHPREEDVVTQSNRHFRTLDPVDDVLRRKVERRRPGAGVFSDLMVYWPDPALGNSSPDVFVVFGLKRPPEEIENSFSVAREGASPCLIFEIVSATYKSGRDKDYEWNTVHYAKAGVEELVLVEPVTRGSPEIRRIVGLRLGAAGTYDEIAPDASGRILLETVGFHVRVEKAAVVLEDAATGERFLTSWEEEDARKAAELRVEEEEEARADEAAARQVAEQALAETLLTVLKNRPLPLAGADRKRILECHDPDQLRRWLEHAFQVDTVDELWD